MREAVTVAERARHDRVAAKARIALVNVVNVVEPNADLASVQAQIEAAIERVGGDELLRGELLHNIGDQYARRGRRDEWRDHHTRALATMEKALPPDHPWLAEALATLGQCVMQVGSVEEAQLYFDRALAIREQVFGPDHPVTADTLTALGWLHFLRGDNERAENYYNRALASLKASLGNEHPALALPINGLLNLYFWQGKVDETKHIAEWLLEVAPGATVATEYVGMLDARQGNADDAVSSCEQLLAVYEERNLPEAQRHGVFLCLGAAYVEQGHPDRALEPLSRGLEIAEQDLAVFSRFTRPEFRFYLARALWDSRRDRRRAIEVAQEARREVLDLRRRGVRGSVGSDWFLASLTDWLDERGVK